MRIVALVLVAACGRDSEKAPPSPSPSPSPSPAPGLELPVVPGYGYEPAVTTGPLVAVTSSGIVVDGKAVARVENGDVAPEDKEGGALGIKIPKLSAILGAVPRADELQLAFDPHTPYRLLISVVFSAKQREAGWKRFGVLARAGDRLVRVPLQLPDRAPAQASSDLASDIELEAAGFDRAAAIARIESSYLADVDRCYEEALKAQPELSGQLRMRVVIDGKGKTHGAVSGRDPALAACVQARMARWTFTVPKARRAPEAASLIVELGLRPTAPRVALLQRSPKLFVSVTRDALILWSVTGEEGTLHDPKWKIAGHDAAALAKVSSALADIVARRWPSGQRPDGARTIVVQADAGAPMQLIAELFGTVRATPDGNPLFPDIVLSSSFE